MGFSARVEALRSRIEEEIRELFLDQLAAHRYYFSRPGSTRSACGSVVYQEE